MTFDLKNNSMEVHHQTTEPWKVTCVDTGLSSMTGGRIRRVRKYLGDEAFCLTYGDGVSNVNITQSIEYHKAQGALATMTAIKPPGRFGAFSLSPEDLRVRDFVEKPQGDGAWINGGFFIVEPKAIDYIPSDDEPWERLPMQQLARDGEMAAYRHEGFWQPMDTLRDKHLLEDLWQSGEAPWKIWKD